MKRLAPAASMVAALAFCTVASASTILSGKYKATFTTVAGEKAMDVLDFKNGSGTVTVEGHVKAHFSVKGTTLTAPAGKACSTVGTYKIHLAANKLTFTVIKDTCKVGRKLILPGHTFTKVG
jgi:hypothetical protein